MTNAQWFLLVGCLMLAMGLNLSVIRRLPVTSAIIYPRSASSSVRWCSRSFISIRCRRDLG